MDSYISYGLFQTVAVTCDNIFCCIHVFSTITLNFGAVDNEFEASNVGWPTLNLVFLPTKMITVVSAIPLLTLGH